jgi:hypothetical protein
MGITSFDEARIMLVALLHEPGDRLVFGLAELSPSERLFLTNTCCATVIAYALCATTNNDVAGALQGLEALQAGIIAQVKQIAQANKR